MSEPEKAEISYISVENHPLYRLGNQVHDHETRLKLLERDFSELTRDFREVKNSIHQIQMTLTELNKDMKDHVGVMEKNIKNELLNHEAREFVNSKELMSRIIWMTVSVVGTAVTAIAYLSFNHFTQTP